MKIIENELTRVRGEIERLRIEEALLVKMHARFAGETGESPKPPRSRSPNVKPVVLRIMHDAGTRGATSTEVDDAVKLIVPTVAKDTVGSILSRLKSDGALVYDGERYYEKQYAPQGDGAYSIRVVK